HSVASHQVTEDSGRDAGALADLAALTPQSGEIADQRAVRFHDVPRHAKSGVAFGAEPRGAASALQQKSQVPEISRGADQRRQRQHRAGEILHENEKAVALDEVRLQRRSTSRRVRIVMLDHCARLVQTAPSRPSRAQAEVGIFAVEEERVVKAAYLV